MLYELNDCCCCAHAALADLSCDQKFTRQDAISTVLNRAQVTTQHLALQLQDTFLLGYFLHSPLRPWL